MRLHNDATGVLLSVASCVRGKVEHGQEGQTDLLCGLVEHLALHGKLIRPIYQVVDLLSSLEDRLDRLVLQAKAGYVIESSRVLD